MFSELGVFVGSICLKIKALNEKLGFLDFNAFSIIFFEDFVEILCTNVNFRKLY